MRRLFALSLVLAFALPAWATPGAPECSAAYPHGFQGNVPMVSYVVANPGAQGYHMQEDYVTWLARTSGQLRDMLNLKATGGPLQFTFVPQTTSMSPGVLFVVVQLYARGSDSQGNAQAYWGDVMVQRTGLKGYLFHFQTHAYEPQGDSMGQILQEAVDATYPRLANGWTCAK